MLTSNKEECDSNKVKIIRWDSINYSLTQLAKTIRETRSIKKVGTRNIMGTYVTKEKMIDGYEHKDYKN